MYEQGQEFKQDLDEAQKWYQEGERHHVTGSLYYYIWQVYGYRLNIEKNERR
jgi:hypothetical protein